MNNTPSGPATSRWGPVPWRWLLLIGLMVLLAGGGFFVLRARSTAR